MSLTAKSGYKQSEIGEIPEVWDCLTVQQLIDKGTISGHLDGNHGELYPRSHEFKSFGVPYIGANNFYSGQVDLQGCKFLSEERAALFKKGVAKDGDVIFAHNATVGPVAKLKTSLKYVILSTTATYFRLNETLLNSDYLMHYMRSELFSSQYIAIMSQSTRNQVPITAQRKLFVVVPPIEEQSKIASSLSVVDALINSLDQLISKKRAIQQATMQQLLTGQRRLPGFREEWKNRELSEVIKEISDGGTPSTADSSNFDGKINWVVIEDIQSEIKNTRSTLTEKGLNKCASKLWPAGTLILSTGATIGEVGVLKIDAATKQGICGIVFNEVVAATIFMRFWFIQNKILLLSKAQGSSIKEIRVPTLVKLCVWLPEVDEQIAIATILSDMDTELAALEAHREKARQLKQGMMQELLTGRIRLA